MTPLYYFVALFLFMVVIYEMFSHVSLYKYYEKTINHYKKCPVFAQPPKFVSKCGRNEIPFMKGRMNALLIQYIVFLLAIGFIFLSAIWYLSYKLNIPSIAGISINSVSGHEMSFLVISTPFPDTLILLIVPIIAINPYTDYLLGNLLQLHKRATYDYVLTTDNSSYASVVLKLLQYTEWKEFSKRLKFGFIPAFMYYISFKLLLIFIIGIEILKGEAAIEAVRFSIAFSFAFLVSCRAISLNEMYCNEVENTTMEHELPHPELLPSHTN